jgi:light-regulated signal transduction histidine kinase (bacteriophytochrome)
MSLSNSLEFGDDKLDILSSILGDQSRYTQILQNFLSNAVKFTEKDGEINVIITILEIQDIQSEAQKSVMKKLFKEKISDYEIDINKVAKDKNF